MARLVGWKAINASAGLGGNVFKSISTIASGAGTGVVVGAIGGGVLSSLNGGSFFGGAARGAMIGGSIGALRHVNARYARLAGDLGIDSRGLFGGFASAATLADLDVDTFTNLHASAAGLREGLESASRIARNTDGMITRDVASSILDDLGARIATHEEALNAVRAAAGDSTIASALPTTANIDAARKALDKLGESPSSKQILGVLSKAGLIS